MDRPLRCSMYGDSQFPGLAAPRDVVTRWLARNPACCFQWQPGVADPTVVTTTLCRQYRRPVLPYFYNVRWTFTHNSEFGWGDIFGQPPLVDGAPWNSYFRQGPHFDDFGGGTAFDGGLALVHPLLASEALTRAYGSRPAAVLLDKHDFAGADIDRWLHALSVGCAVLQGYGWKVILHVDQCTAEVAAAYGRDADGLYTQFMYDNAWGEGVGQGVGHDRTRRLSELVGAKPYIFDVVLAPEGDQVWTEEAQAYDALRAEIDWVRTCVDVGPAAGHRWCRFLWTTLNNQAARERPAEYAEHEFLWRPEMGEGIGWDAQPVPVQHG